MKKVLIIANEWTTIVNFRMELLDTLIKDGYNVCVALPASEYDAELKATGCKVIDLPVSRKGLNPFVDLKMIFQISKIIDSERPNCVFTYTIKPNAYGGLVCCMKKVPYFATVTGLGTSIENGGILQKVSLMLYRIGLKRANVVFFQNEANMAFMVRHRICGKKYLLLPGSGVNLQRFKLMEYPETEMVNFIYVARAMKEKGIDQYLDAAKAIKAKYPNTVFHICGMCEQGYETIINEYSNNGLIKYHGQVRNMPDVYSMASCTIHPSFYPEGMSNVLLESAATGRPIITTDRAGCREIIDDGINGYVVKQQDSQDLIDKIEKFLSLTIEERKNMGLAGRKKVEKEFDRKIVVSSYLRELEQICIEGQ